MSALRNWSSAAKPLGVVLMALAMFAGTTWFAWPVSAQNPPDKKCQYVVRSITLINPQGPACAYVSGSTVCGDCIRHAGTGDPPIPVDWCPEDHLITRGNCDLLLASAGGSTTGACVVCTEGPPGPDERPGIGGGAPDNAALATTTAERAEVLFVSTRGLKQTGQAETIHADRLRTALEAYRYGDATRAALDIEPNGRSIVEPLKRVVRERRAGGVSDDAWMQLARSLVSGSDVGSLQQELQKQMPVGARSAFDPAQWQTGDPGELFSLPRELMELANAARPADESKAATLAKAAMLLESQTYVYLPPLFLNALTATPPRAEQLKDVAGLSDEQVQAIKSVAEQAVTDAAGSEQGLMKVVEELGPRNRRKGPLVDSQLQRLSRVSVAVASPPEKRPTRVYFTIHAIAKAMELVRERNGDEAATALAEQIREGVDFGDDPVVNAWADRALGQRSE